MNRNSKPIERGNGGDVLKGEAVHVLGTISREENDTYSGEVLELPLPIKNLIKRSVDLVFLADEDASFIIANEAVCQLLGYSIEDLMTLKTYDVDVLNDLVSWQKTFKKLRKLGSLRIETMQRNREGDLFPVELTLNYLIHSGREFCLGIGRDISERRKMEEALKASEEKYRAVVEDQIELICRFMADGTITFANRAFCQFYDETGEDVVGKSYLSVVPEQQYPVFTASIEELLESPGQAIFDIQPYKKGDTTRWMEQTLRALVSENGQAERFQVVLRDITDKRKAEQALRDSKEQYQLVFDRMQDGFAVFEVLYGEDGEVIDARFLEVNPAFEKMMGVKEINIVGKTMWQVFPTMRLASADLWKSLISDIKNVQIEELYSRTLDKYLRVSGLSLKKGRYALLVSDLTENKKMMEKLLRADRLSSLGEMAAGLAHEINNPLTGVMGISQLLIERRDLPENIRDDAGTIFREANRAANILKDFLFFARGQKPDKQNGEINNIIESVLKLRRTYMKKSNIEVFTSLDRDLPKLLIDISQIQQVFLNIVLNAEYFMFEAHKKGKFHISTCREDDIIKTVFADDGPGITTQNISRIFDPFYTTKELGHGTGLGLSISYGIVKEHSGNIHVESKPGEGATFIIELPVCTQ